MNCFASVVFPGVNPHATANVCARESMREFLCLSLQFFFSLQRLFDLVCGSTGVCKTLTARCL